ncbi:PD-(D/E)XK nuclease family protein [Thermodesulfovibrio sp. 3907-1M]|uniref:PD-(D/E)XK nuclease family protein n=1 Tax=Thermodesulfovibrio autotrophicus TaxID=3118333 RepID=A0AAU8GXI9_9BACT
MDELGFLKEAEIIAINSSEDIIQKIVDIIYADGYDYSANFIVFPGKRPSHYLKKYLAQKVKQSFIPPRVFSADEFIEFLFRKMSNASPIETIEAVGIIYEICLKHNLLSPFFKKFDNFISFGFKLFNLFEELYIEEIHINKLKEVENLIDIPIKSQEKLRFLSVIYQNFYEELIQRNLCTRGLRYRKVADCISLQDLEFKILIYAGFFAFTASEKRILEKLSKIKNFYFIFQKEPEFNEKLFSKINLYSCPDTHAEVKVVGRIMEKSAIDEKTVIVLPKSDTLFPLLRQGIPFLKEENYNISMGYPLNRTPIYGFFINLFEVVNSIENNQFYTPLYLKFMLHPYTKNVLIKNSAELSRIIFHEIENLLISKEISFVELEWIEKEIPVAVASNLKDFTLTVDDIRQHIEMIHNNTIKKFTSIKNIEEFIKNCRDVLLFVYEKTTARFHPLFYPYVEAFIAQFDKLLNSLIKNFQFEHLESYFNFFKNLIMFENVPFAGTPLKGLQILGFLETRNIKFKKVIFLDLNEGIFPPLSEDYLMPYKVRKILGLPTYHEREKLVYYYFSLLIDGAEEAHLCYIKNDINERSRFIEKIIWEAEKSEARRIDIPVKSLSWAVNLTTRKPAEIYKSDETMEVINNLCFSPSSIDDYLDCGLKFYYSYVLKLKKKKELSAELEHSEIGTIVHESLKEYLRLRKNKKLNPDDFGNDIESIVQNIFSKKYGSKVTGKVYLIKLQILQRLLQLIEYYKKLSKIRRLKILEVEELIEENLFNASFIYRIDLVESIDDSITIVDYKISGTEQHYKIKFDKLNIFERENWSKYIGSLQIPLYMLLYAQKHKLSVFELKGCYFLLGKALLNDDTVRFDPFNQNDKEECIRTVSTVIETLLNEIKDKDIPFLPAFDFKSKCRICDYQPICGTLTIPSKTSSAGPVI